MPNDVLVRSSLGRQAADIIRERIYSGEMAPGERVKEETFSTELGISRSCVRDAILLLEGEGLVIKQANKGAVVRSFTKKEVFDLLLVRHTIELRSILICIENNTVPVELLQRQIELMHSAGSRTAKKNCGQAELLSADIEFHELLIFSADNEYLSMFWRSIKSQYSMLMLRLFRVREKHFSLGVSNHQVILDAIVNGADRCVLEKELYDHIMANYESVSQCVL